MVPKGLKKNQYVVPSVVIQVRYTAKLQMGFLVVLYLDFNVFCSVVLITQVQEKNHIKRQNTTQAHHQIQIYAYGFKSKHIAHDCSKCATCTAGPRALSQSPLAGEYCMNGKKLWSIEMHQLWILHKMVFKTRHIEVR